jgi:hypothetical protein
VLLRMPQRATGFIAHATARHGVCCACHSAPRGLLRMPQRAGDVRVLQQRDSRKLCFACVPLRPRRQGQPRRGHVRIAQPLSQLACAGRVSTAQVRRAGAAWSCWQGYEWRPDTTGRRGASCEAGALLGPFNVRQSSRDLSRTAKYLALRLPLPRFGRLTGDGGLRILGVCSRVFCCACMLCMLRVPDLHLPEGPLLRDRRCFPSWQFRELCALSSSARRYSTRPLPRTSRGRSSAPYVCMRLMSSLKHNRM